MTYLSPASQKVRILRLQTERKNLAQKMKKYDHLSVSLGSEQSADLSNIVNIINHDQCIRSELDEILFEADKHKEGHGSILQDIWDGDSIETEEESFNVDQKKNHKFSAMHYNALHKIINLQTQEQVVAQTGGISSHIGLLWQYTLVLLQLIKF